MWPVFPDRPITRNSVLFSPLHCRRPKEPVYMMLFLCIIFHLCRYRLLRSWIQTIFSLKLDSFRHLFKLCNRSLLLSWPSAPHPHSCSTCSGNHATAFHCSACAPAFSPSIPDRQYCTVYAAWLRAHIAAYWSLQRQSKEGRRGKSNLPCKQAPGQRRHDVTRLLAAMQSTPAAYVWHVPSSARRICTSPARRTRTWRHVPSGRTCVSGQVEFPACFCALAFDLILYTSFFASTVVRTLPFVLQMTPPHL